MADRPVENRLTGNRLHERGAVAELAGALHARLHVRIRDLLEARADRARLGALDDYQTETVDVRGGIWQLSPPAGQHRDQPLVVNTTLDWSAGSHPDIDADIDADIAPTILDVATTLVRQSPPRHRAGTGPYFAVAGIEHHREARLWNDLFCQAQDHLGLHRGIVRVTPMVGPAARYQLDEILYELRDHADGLIAADASLAVIVEETNLRRGAAISGQTARRVKHSVQALGA